jgi:hypothetical protein
MKVSLLALLTLASCAHLEQNSIVGQSRMIGVWPLRGAPEVDGKIRLGGFSGLCCQDSKEGVFTLVSVSDRGPNRDPVEIPGTKRVQRPFVFPAYVPEIMITTWSSKDGWSYSKRVPLFWTENKKAVPASGLPNSPLDESPVSDRGDPLALDPRGIDPEGIVLQDDHYWIVEEYGPSILKVAKSGEILKRWIPRGTKHRLGVEELPAELAQRAVNRGFEGVALVGTQLYAFLQSPLAPANDEITVLVWDTIKEASVGLVKYPLHHAKANKIGDVTSIGDGRLLVLEQDGKTTADARRKVFSWNPASGEKTLVLDLSEAGFVGREKAEGLALLAKDRLAVVSDNDYGLKNETPSEIAIFEIAILP